LRYHVEVKRSAQRDLARLPARVREDVARALNGLAENPRPRPPAGKPLKGVEEALGDAR
jgi:mRNA-degrading endonuclease RelE of RelBE toxin-antitoxin system